MTNIVLIKRSATANTVPTAGQLANGEIAINYADGNLFFKDTGGSVQTLASKKFVSVTGNVTGGNVNAGIVSATGNVQAGNVNAGIVSATGNVQAGNVNAAGLSLSANVVSALNSTANITTTANIAGGYFIGNGSQLTGITAGSNYSNSNVATLLANFGSNTISTTGNVTTGNLTVNGNITYVNSNVVTINDKFINVANNAATAGAANGGGLGVGPVDAEYATLIFNNGTTAWNTNIPLSVNGNVAGNYFVGNGSALTSISGASVVGAVANATYAVSAGSAGSAVTAEQVTFAVQANITGVGTLGNLTVSGNTTVGNLSTGGFVSATGNVTGGNLRTTGLISATGNITGGNILGGANVNATTHTGTTASLTGNVTGGNILTGGLISATGNITGGNILGGANVNATTHTGTTASLTGNVTGGNILTDGLISATGNITGGNILGGANVNATTHTGTTASLTGNVTGGNLLTAGLISATGNITGGNILGGANVNATTHTGTTVSVTGNIQGGNLLISNADASVGSVSTTAGWYYETSISVAAQDTEPRGVFFKPDGTRMYVAGEIGNDIIQYDLGTAWNVSTATYGNSFSVSSQGTFPYDVHFKSDGTVMYVMDGSNDDIDQYTLSSAWDIGSASFASIQFSLSGQETAPTGFWFRPDGTQLFVTGTSGDDVNEYSLGTAWNVGTATFVRVSSSLAAYETAPEGLAFSSDGTKMWIVGSTYNRITQFDLSTPWNVSTLSYNSQFPIYGSGPYAVAGASGLYVNESAGVAYVSDYENDRIFQYDTNTPTGQFYGPQWTTETDFNVGNNLSVNSNFFAGGSSRLVGAVTAATSIASPNHAATSSSGTTSLITGTTSGTINFATGITTGTLNQMTVQTTGNFTLGGTGATGAITIGRSTANQSIVIGNGVTALGSVKTIDIGTLGALGSNTNVTVGSATSGAVTNITLYGNTAAGNLSTTGLISATGNFTTTGTIKGASTIGVGNATPSTSGAGITFPATQNASADANTLDDYEEGTFTPNQGGGLTVVGTFSSSGAYTKIGKLVTVQVVLSATTSISITAGDAVMFTNLPFASSPNRNPGVAVNTAHSAGLFVNIASSTVYSCGTIGASATIFVSITYQTS